jgi:magnesium transporter
MDSLHYKMVSYDSGHAQVTEDAPFDYEALRGDGKIHWVDISDLSCREEIERIVESCGIHRLIIEDILNTGQMVKMDNYDDCLFLVMKLLDYNRGDTRITEGHVSVILKGNIVMSIHNSHRDIFAQVRKKITADMDNVRDGDGGYLCYELADTVVDTYFGVMDDLGDVVDGVEEDLIARPDKTTLQQIYFVKRKLMSLRKSVFPLREHIGVLCGTQSGQIGRKSRIYFRDVYDHLIQISDTIVTYQDIMSNMLDTYLSSVSNRTNETMKVLTIISTIFIPLSFLAGVYGMNFKYIPELGWEYGYFIFWVISAVIVVGMMFFFRKKKWF